MVQNLAYMLVTPPPRYANTLNMISSQDVNENCFYVKFGDGELRDEYKTHNPIFAGKACDEAGTEKTAVKNENDHTEYKWSGKALEWNYLQRVPGDKSEWHRVTPITPYTYAELRTDLAHLLDTFDSITLDPKYLVTDPRRAATLDWDKAAVKLFIAEVKKVRID